MTTAPSPSRLPARRHWRPPSGSSGPVSLYPWQISPPTHAHTPHSQAVAMATAPLILIPPRPRPFREKGLEKIRRAVAGLRSGY